MLITLVALLLLDDLDFNLKRYILPIFLALFGIIFMFFLFMNFFLRFISEKEMEDEWRIPWGGISIFLILGLFYFLTLFVGIFSGTLSSILGTLVLILCPILVVKYHGLNPRILGFSRVRLKIFLLILVFGFLYFPLNQFLSYLTYLALGDFPFYQELLDSIREDLVVTVPFIVFFGPIGEEIFFRGYAYPVFRRYGIKTGIILSSLFFAFYHLLAWQFLTAFVAGVILSYIYERTQNIYLCITFHIVSNAIGLSVMLLNP